MNGEFVMAPDEELTGGFSQPPAPMPVSSMSDQQYMQAALASSAPPPPPATTMAAGPTITKAAPSPPADDYAQRALAAGAGPGPDAAYRQQAVDAGASVQSAPAQVVGVHSTGGPAHETVAILPGARKALDKSDEAITNAGFKSTLNSMQNAENEADFYKRENLKAQATEDAAADVKARRSVEMQRMGDDIAQSAADLAKFKIDPERKENSRSVGSRFFDALSAGLLSLGGQSTDPVFDRIKADNDADVDAQKQEYAARMQGQKGKETTYEMMMKRYGTEDAADAATRAAGMDRAKLELGAIGADAKHGDAQAAFGDLTGRLESEKQKYIAAHVKMTGGKTSTFDVRLGNGATVQMTPAQYNNYQIANGTKDADASRAAGVSVATESAKMKGETVKDAKKDEKDNRERFVATDDKGGGYLAPTAEEAKHQREQRAGIADMRKQLNAIKAEREKLDYGDKASGLNPFYSSARVRKLQSMSSSLLTTMNKGKGLGALDNGSLKVLGDQIGQLSTVNPLNDPTPNIESLLGEAERSLQTSESGGSGYTQTAPTGAKKGW